MSNPAKVLPRRRIRAKILGFGFDGETGGPRRILTGEHCLVIGGSAESHQTLADTMLRLEAELDRREKSLAEIHPRELLDIALDIDSPELIDLALRLKEGLERRGIHFEELAPSELNELAVPWSG